MTDIAKEIVALLDDVDLVLGWDGSGAGGVAAPAAFSNPEEAGAAVFDATCIHNLAVHLPRLRDKTVGIVAKSCDERAVAQLISEREIDRERVRVIQVKCPEMIDVKSIWRRFGYGTIIDFDGKSLRVGGVSADPDEFIPVKCMGCEGRGRTSAAAGGKQPAHPEREKFDAMPPADRRVFWREHYERCIRCYACREACPMCYCRDACIMQTREPHWIGGGADAVEAEMMQLIRVNHMAGRCTGCGECERACPVGIPLMLLMEEQNRATKDLFGYNAGTDPEARPPLLTFDIEGDNWGEK